MKGEMVILGQRGDTKIIWDTDNAAEVANARETWEKLVGEDKFLAFRVKRNGEAGEQVTVFDATLGKLIIVPPMAGG